MVVILTNVDEKTLKRTGHKDNSREDDGEIQEMGGTHKHITFWMTPGTLSHPVSTIEGEIR
jgi:hypothetical protein